MSLKAFVRAATPPALWNTIRALQKSHKTFPTWEAAARSAGGSYDSELVNKFRVARIDVSSPAPLESNALGWLMEFLPSSSAIVDFGGATGDVGRALKAAGHRFHYTVVENDTLVNLMPRQADWTFTSSIPSSCDVFFSSCALNYIANPYDVLDQGFRAARRAVVLTRNSFSERDIFRVHKSWLFENGSGGVPPGYVNTKLSCPFRTVRENRIREIAKKHGFRLICRTRECDNHTIPGGGVYGAQLVWIK